jgi:hypothetical protein
MNRLVVAVPLREGGYEAARRLLERGPPIDLEATRFDRHEVYLTRHEVVFVFETPRPARRSSFPARIASCGASRPSGGT